MNHALDILENAGDLIKQHLPIGSCTSEYACDVAQTIAALANVRLAVQSALEDAVPSHNSIWRNPVE